MNPVRLFGLCALLLTTPLFSQGDEDFLAEFGDVIGVEVINVEVRVTGSDGRPITGLGREDFSLEVDGESVPISNFYAVEERLRQSDPIAEVGTSGSTETRPDDPLFLVVLIDDLHLAPFSRNRRLGDLQQALGEILDPGDRVMLARSTHVVEEVVPFTDDLDEIAEGIATVREIASFGMRNEDRHRETIEDMLQLHDASVQGFGGPCPSEMGPIARNYMASVHDEVRATVRALETFAGSLDSLPGRRAVLMVSDGLPADPGAPIVEWIQAFCGGSGSAQGLRESYDVSSSFASAYTPANAQGDASGYVTVGLLDDAIDRANASGVTIFTLEAYGPRPAGRRVALDERASTSTTESARIASFQSGLYALAADTGGRALFNVTQADPRIARLDDDLDTYYSIGFQLDEDTGEKPLSIDVSVDRPGARVHHRRNLSRKPLDARLADRTRGALNFALTDNPLDVRVEVGEPVPMDESLFLVPIRLRIPIGKVALLEQGDVHRGQLSLFVAARDRSGRDAPVRNADIPLSISTASYEAARTQDFLYEVKMLMRRGDHTVAIGLRDEVGGDASYIVENVLVMATATR